MNPTHKLTPGMAHVITVGTTPPGGSDVVDALIEDLKPAKPKHVIVLATADSSENAQRLLKAFRLGKKNGAVIQVESAQSLDQIYQATQQAISDLLAAGFQPGDIILHYTAGTKVMSAGAVLAALNHDVRALRYLYSHGRNAPSEPVMTSPSAVLGDRQVRLAMTLMLELRFQSAAEVLSGIDTSMLSDAQRECCDLLRELAPAYANWDSFRAEDFLQRYRPIADRLEACPQLQDFKLTQTQIAALERIGNVGDVDGEYPEELLLDLYNNGIRRLAERRPDDSLIRFHRAAELYAQTILLGDFGIRTDDVDVRKIPPRSRTLFEAERRLDDATIKLGLRKSYDLLQILDHPVGEAYADHARFHEVLDSRRSLVLAHGTRPASMALALDFLREVEELFNINIKQVRKRATALQFPWLDNSAIIKRLHKQPSGTESVLKRDEKQIDKAEAKRKRPTRAKKRN